MAAFDYTIPQRCFDYGGSSGNGTDPVNEPALMGQLVTGMSRALDQYCNQVLYAQTVSSEVLRAVVDAEGVLTCYPAVPTMAQPTAAAWRRARSATWNTLDAALLDVEQNTFGCVVRTLDQSHLAERGERLQVRLSYVGGYADLAALPADLEWNVRRLCWWAYQKRSAPMEKTAIPELGVLIVPSGWPPDVKAALRSYVRQVPM